MALWLCDLSILVAHRGYLAPEYALLGQLTRKADVYSFGILVLEIVSGRSSSKAAFGEELMVLVEWVCFWTKYRKVHNSDDLPVFLMHFFYQEHG